ncbi:MAG TPA: xanthine dehydrogenase family protein molybdopterin-binding subunit [Stellaceae bacterium]|nr:xanthine dehydrogenase family protein molybdopterin-binding subunit [Stellaceae bacterium]
MKLALIGETLRRREDRRLLLGLGQYLDDLRVPGCLQAVFVRSPYGRARIRGIDTASARRMPGVAAILTGADLAALAGPLRTAPPIKGLHPVAMPPLPIEEVRFAGDPVALVLATDRTAAELAVDAVAVGWEALPAVTSIAAASRPDAPSVDPALGTNLVSQQSFASPGLPEVFARAPRVVTTRFGQQRQTHTPIEPRGCLARWDRGREHLTMITGTQAPHPYRTALAARLGLREAQVTIEAPDIGGAFGQKVALLREELAVAAAARLLHRPVQWRETRQENLVASLHAREEQVLTRAAVREDGTILALSCEIDSDFGAWCFFPANYMARVIAMILPGPYRIARYGYEVRVWLTNKCPSGPMRAPMAIASWVMEGTIDAVAWELRLDPLEVRRRNMLEPGDLPYVTATGERYAAITPRATLEAAVSAIGYDAFRAEQARALADGRLLGLGLCTVVESTTYGSGFYKAAGIPGSGHEAAMVRVEPSGAVIGSCGLMGSGQGYETTLAQALAAGLGAKIEDVAIRLGHTDIAPYGMGSRGSRGATAGGGALYLAGARLKAKALAIAAGILGLNSADSLDLRGGAVWREAAAGWQDTGLSLGDIARLAYLEPLRLPPGQEPGLHLVLAYDPPAMTYSNGTHACVVEIDRETGAPHILRYLLAEDAGTVINPLVVAGQAHGAVAMGLSGALMEHAVYDADGQFLSGSLMDYALARAADLPRFAVIPMDTPNPDTPAGLKGMAEGGVMGAIGAVMNAVNDALAQVGANLAGQPASAPRIWQALRQAGAA